MNLTVKFTSELAAVTMDVRRLSCNKGKLVLHYMQGSSPTRHIERIENVERLFLDASGARGLMKVLEQESSTYENVRKLTITQDALVLEEMVDRVATTHHAEPAKLETLEIT